MPAFPPGTPVDRATAERGFNNREAVPDHPAWFARWREASQAAREALPHRLDLRYGPGPRERLDLFLPRAGSAPRGTLLFFHGGWWRGLDKSDHSFIAPAFADAGYAVALPSYDLCPQVGIGAIVDEARRAYAWLLREGEALGANAGRVVVGGHSAGGHLTAMLFATDWKAEGLDGSRIAGGVTLSGVHDLRPLTLFSGNADFRLDDAEAARLSPLLRQPTIGAPLLVAVGGDETGEFIRQSAILRDAWPNAVPKEGPAGMVIEGRHHFDVVFDYTDPASALTRATLALFDGAPGGGR